MGKVLLSKALENGYRIKTLLRNPEKLGIYKDKLAFRRWQRIIPEKIMGKFQLHKP